MTGYAIISLGGKQYRVQEGQRLLVDRLPYAEQKTFHPRVLLVGGDGKAEIAPKSVEVTARVLEHVLGEKILIGKHKATTGYRRRAGHRSRLSQVEIETIGQKKQAARKKAAEEGAEEKPAASAKPPAAEKKTKAPAKPAAEKTED